MRETFAVGMNEEDKIQFLIHFGMRETGTRYTEMIRSHLFLIHFGMRETRVENRIAEFNSSF